MADLIRLLPDHVANQIAAGEVVQRPASVVKELLENSVDAGAEQIVLVVKDAGRTLVQVTDDGRGMSPTDARLCFERHATSKIRVADDLRSLTTKGFRGEALASIAAIAQVELRTRRPEDELGTRVLIEGSRVRIQEPFAGNHGSTIAVRSLFYNVPARRQFLKSDAVELKHVVEEFQRVALAYPAIAFQLVHNGQEVFHLLAGEPGEVAGTGAAYRQRIAGLFGKRYDERLVPVEEATGHLGVGGYIGKPEFAKRTRGEQYFFVNGRFIRSPYLEHAVRAAFSDLVGRENHPSWFLFLSLDPERIDINIHPTKTEIKFRDDREVYAIVHAAVRRALGRFNITPSLDFEPEPVMVSALSGGGGTATQSPPAWRPNDLGIKPATGWQGLFDMPSQPGASQGDLVPTDGGVQLQRTVPWREFDGSSEERPMFQLHGRYILSPLRSGFMVVDPTRAQERILYERCLRSLERGSGTSQAQLFPRTMELSPADHALVTDLSSELRSLGFDLGDLGGRTITISGLPAEAADEDAVQLLEGMLEQLREERSALRNERHAALARSMARSMVHRGARSLRPAEMHDLIDRLFACEMPLSTPAGKPTLITFGLDDLNERFERG